MNVTASYNRNLCIKSIPGQYRNDNTILTFIDADDIAFNIRTEILVKFFKKGKKRVLLHSGDVVNEKIINLYKDNVFKYDNKLYKDDTEVYKKALRFHGHVSYNYTDLLYDDELTYGEDVQHIANLKDNGYEIIYLNSKLSYYIRNNKQVKEWVYINPSDKNEEAHLKNEEFNNSRWHIPC